MPSTFDLIWADFAQRRVPAVLHVAANGEYNAVSQSFNNNGRSELALGGEPVGWIIENIGAHMRVFAPDYPHPEGTGNPIGKFERNMPNCDQATMDKFYHGNALELMNPR